MGVFGRYMGVFGRYMGWGVSCFYISRYVSNEKNCDEVHIFLYSLPKGSSTVSDIHFGQFSHVLHAGIESTTTFYCHIL